MSRSLLDVPTLSLRRDLATCRKVRFCNVENAIIRKKATKACEVTVELLLLLVLRRPVDVADKDKTARIESLPIRVLIVYPGLAEAALVAHSKAVRTNDRQLRLFVIRFQYGAGRQRREGAERLVPWAGARALGGAYQTPLRRLRCMR
jgi:hypothetical protein